MPSSAQVFLLIPINVCKSSGWLVDVFHCGELDTHTHSCMQTDLSALLVEEYALEQ
jgi:hypothetical protein